MNKYRYNDKSERCRRMNQFALLAADLLFVVWIAYLGMLLAAKEITMATGGWDIILLIVTSVINIAIFVKNGKNNRFRYTILLK